MARPTNRELLTKGDQIYARKKNKKFGVDEVTFDRDARKEYLTGFHKRKVQRKEKAAERAKEMERQEKIEARKKLRQERKEQVERELKRLNDAMKEINGEDDSDSSPEQAAAGSDSDFSDWDGIEGNSEGSINGRNGILKNKQKYSDDTNDDGVTTVTVEEFNFDDEEPSDKPLPVDENVDLSKSEEVLKSSLAKASMAKARLTAITKGAKSARIHKTPKGKKKGRR